MTTANHAVLANAIHALDGTRDNGAQVIFTVEEPELAPTSASIGVEVHDVVADERRLFTVTIQEV